MSTILERLKSGEVIREEDEGYSEIREIINRTLRLSQKLNNATTTDEIRAFLGEIIGQEIDKSTTIMTPFHTNFGKFISIGKNVFINHACSFIDMGGITIEDGAFIGPRVNLVTKNHLIEPEDRGALHTDPIVVKKNAWIGANATILPGVTVGENAIVAAGAVVHSNAPKNTVVGGVPAKIIKTII